jgi:hypothetical protein
LQIGVSQARYFDVPISSDGSLNSLFGFTRINMLKLNLNSRPRREKSFSIELIRLPSNSWKTTQASRATDLSRLGGNASRQISVQKIIHIKSQLCMTSTSYCYRKCESSDDEDNRHINRVGVKEEDVEDGNGRDAELIEIINHYMTPPTLRFEVMSAGDHYRCNDWANSCRHSGL